MSHNACCLYACSYEMQTSNADVSHNIRLRGPYKCPVGWTCWLPVGNAAMKNLPEERPSDNL